MAPKQARHPPPPSVGPTVARLLLCSHMASSDRAALKALADERTALEREVAAIVSRLSAPGQPGVTGSLLDAEVRRVRATR